MGIRFYCPNGHKLNVKAEQAGKIGYCPDCGARVQIPFESTRPAGHNHSGEQSSRRDSVGSDDLLLTSKTEQSEPLPQPSAPPAENSVTWYMQGGDGRKYGPVDTQTIHTWISENRVAAATMVWREGWSEWKEAKDVFAEFSTPSVPPAIGDLFSGPAEKESAVPLLTKNTRSSETASKAKLLKKKQRAFRDLMMVIVLSVIILILAVVLLLLVLRTGKKEEPAGPPEPPQASVLQNTQGIYAAAFLSGENRNWKIEL